MNQGESVRKSAYGRTNVLLQSKGVIMKEIQSTASVSRNCESSLYHTHPLCFSYSNVSHDSACWHCCHSFESEMYQLPRVFDADEQIYHVYGCFCSAECAKAHILEQNSFDRNQQLNNFTRMLEEVYGITEQIHEAPPRVTLKMFGGVFGIEKFRSHKTTCRLITPPFVSYCMVVEEKNSKPAAANKITPRGHSSGVQGLKRPIGHLTTYTNPDVDSEKIDEGTYVKYLAEKQTSSPPVSKVGKKTATAQIKEKPKKNGGLQKFIEK